MEKSAAKDTSPAVKPKGWRRLRRLVVIATVQLFIALVLFEILARIFNPLGISYYPETARFFDTMVHVEPIAYHLRPGLDGLFNGARYQVNSIGLRGPEIPSTKPDGELRVLWLGDSVVFGIGVNNDQTLPSVVERLSNEPAREQKTRVVNMGVPSYNTEQELMQFETLGLGLQPDAVLLLFSANDIEPMNWVFEKRRSWMADFAQRSYALSTIFVVSRLAVQSTGTQLPLINMQNYADDNPRWRAIADSLVKIHQICNSRSIPFIVLVMDPIDGMPFNMVADEGKKDGFEVIGLRPDLDPRWPDALSARYHNSFVDMHPNPLGTEMWGRLVYENLVRRGIVEVAPQH